LTILVILILGILWVAVLVPPIMRARGQQGQGHGIGDFTHRLASVGRTLGHRDRRSHGASASRPLYLPTGPATMGGGPTGGGMSGQQKRRRDVLLVLGAAAGFTLLLALFTRSTMFIALFLVAAAALGGYVFLLLQYKQRAQERTTKVRYLGAAEYGNTSPSYAGSYAGAYSSALADGAGESSSTRIVPLRQTAAR
jgi:hypothetical protein